MKKPYITTTMRYKIMPVGCIVYRRRSPSGRVNSRNGSLTQGGEVYWDRSLSYL